MTRSILMLMAAGLCFGCDDGDPKASQPARSGSDAAGALDGAANRPDAVSSGADAAADGAARMGRPDSTIAADAGPVVFPERCAEGPMQTVAVPTSDGLELVADWYPGGRDGRAVVLLHMIPPSNNRTNYPAGFITALTERGFGVLNVDRRGAGDSPGVAREAFEGPKGVLDAEGAYAYLEGTGCVNMKRVGWIGASNGTTTVLDYTIKSAAEPAREIPAAVVYLTGGAYTENQNKIGENRGALDGVDTLFIFSTAERAWSAAFAEGAPETWRFLEYDPGAHGTRMFGVQLPSIVEIADHLKAVIQ